MPDPARLAMAIRELRQFRPAAVYLIGSAARGSMHPDSDIDLAFLPDRACDPLAVFEAANRIAGLLGRPVDRRINTYLAEIEGQGTGLDQS